MAVLGLVSCKKSEENKPANTTQPGQTTPQPKQAEGFKPHKKGGKKGGDKGEGKGEKEAAALELYNEKNLVTSIPQAQYPTLVNQKIKIKNKEFQAVLLKDLLAKYKLQGKNVTLEGAQNSTTLTWQQATASNLYVYITPKKGMKLYTTDGATESGLPKKLEKVTVSATAEAQAPAKKEETPQKKKTS